MIDALFIIAAYIRNLGIACAATGADQNALRLYHLADALLDRIADRLK